MREKFEERVLTPIEGVWLWNSGAIVAIEADTRGSLTLTLEDSPDPELKTPCVIGTGTYSGASATYNVDLLPNVDLVRKKSKIGVEKVRLQCIVDGSRLKIKPYSTGYTVSLWRLIPYLFRMSVTRKNEPDNLYGAIRVWPPVGSSELPVVL